MNNQHIATYSNKHELIKKKFSKQVTKSFCKLKVNKFRKQPAKLYVNATYLWRVLSKTNTNTVQYLTFSKYKNVRLSIAECQGRQKTTINLCLNQYYTKDLWRFQPWYSVMNNNLIVVNPQSNHVIVLNIKKISIVYITCHHRTNGSKSVQHKKTKKLLCVRMQSHENRKVKMLSKYVVKFSKKWFLFEHSKFKRFKIKYDGRDLKKKAPIRSLRTLTTSKFKKRLLKKYSNKFLLIKDMLVTEKDRNERLKELFKKLKETPKATKKKSRYKYAKFKYKRRATKLKKTSQTDKTLRVTVHNNNVLQPAKSVAAYLTQNASNVSQKFESFKIKLLQRVTFVSTNASKQKSSKYSFKTKKLKATLKKINNQLKYKLKWSNFYEFKSFRWKFQKKRWYYTMSKWKRLAEFRRMLRSAWRSHRKLQKNFLFIKLLRANFKHILGIKEDELLKKWVKIRRGTNSNNTISSVDFLNQALQLKLDGLSMFLGLAPNRLMAQELVRFGGLRINGLVVTDSNFSLHQNDMLQIDSKTIQSISTLYKDTHWTFVRARLKFASFLQAQWSIMLFMLIRWPQNYELLEESILNQRWIRFFIRYFPVRIAKYKKAKVKWYKY